MWGEQDSNLRSRKTTELQSVPFGRSGISPEILLYFNEHAAFFEPIEGLEPTTC